MSARGLTTAAAVAIALLAIPTSASASAANPYLHVSPATAKQALHCTPGWRHQRGEPVLLVHGTATTAEQSWGSNYLIALPQARLGTCTVALPRRALGDIQHAAEYVVRAVRFMARRSGGKVDVVGHSQGTLEPRWAVKWWRSARRRTDDLVLLASPSHGTASATGLCLAGVCEAAAWQMSFGSQFLKALNRGDESPGPVAVTSIYSQLDDLVQPPKTARLDGGSSVDLQALCPARPVHHGSILFDAVAWQVTVDALTGTGPADLERAGPPPCADLFIPGIPVEDALLGDILLYGDAAPALVQEGQRVGAEPPLRAYARRSPDPSPRG